MPLIKRLAIKRSPMFLTRILRFTMRAEGRREASSALVLYVLRKPDFKGIHRFFSYYCRRRRTNLYDESKQASSFSLAGTIWVSGVLLGLLTVLVFPITTVSLYCNRSILSPEGVSFVFHKIYYFTLPLGIACVTVTSELTVPNEIEMGILRRQFSSLRGP